MTTKTYLSLKKIHSKTNWIRLTSLEVSKPINHKFLENLPISKTVSTRMETMLIERMTQKYKTFKVKTEKQI